MLTLIISQIRALYMLQPQPISKFIMAHTLIIVVLKFQNTGLPELSIAADSASMYNVLTNSLQTVLLLLLVLNAVCGRKLQSYKTERKSINMIEDMEEGLKTGESPAEHEKVHEEIDLRHPTVEREIQTENESQTNHNTSVESSQRHEDIIITNQHTPNDQPDTDSPAAAHKQYEINDNESGLELQPSIGGVVKINPLIALVQ